MITPAQLMVLCSNRSMAEAVAQSSGLNLGTLMTPLSARLFHRPFLLCASSSKRRSDTQLEKLQQRSDTIYARRTRFIALQDDMYSQESHSRQLAASRAELCNDERR